MRIRQVAGPLVLLLALLVAGCAGKTDSTTTSIPGDNQNLSPTPGLATLAVHLPDSAPKVWEVETDQKLSVRDLMVALREAQLSFTDTLYPGMGHLVTSVAGIKNPKGAGAYWQFCVDNVASDRGVDEQQVGPGQRVDWHLAEHGKLPCKKVGE